MENALFLNSVRITLFNFLIAWVSLFFNKNVASVLDMFYILTKILIFNYPSWKRFSTTYSLPHNSFSQRKLHHNSLAHCFNPHHRYLINSFTSLSLIYNRRPLVPTSSDILPISYFSVATPSLTVVYRLTLSLAADSFSSHRQSSHYSPSNTYGWVRGRYSTINLGKYDFIKFKSVNHRKLTVVAC